MTAPFSSVSGTGQPAGTGWTPEKERERKAAGAAPGGPDDGTTVMPHSVGGAPQPQAPAGAQPSGAMASLPPTFTQLQQAGQPRPAPPPTMAMPTFGAAPSTMQPTALQPQIMQSLQSLMAKPSSYDTEAMRKEYNAGARTIDDEFATNQRLATEEMARRGLSDSSIRGGRMADLNVGKRSAQVELQDRLQTKLADRQSEDLRSALSLAMGYDDSMFSRSIQTDTLGLEKDKFAYQRSNDAANRATDTDRFLQELGLKREDLGLQRDELSWRKDESAADRAQRGSEFDRTIGLDKEKFAYTQQADALEQAFREKGLAFDREKFMKSFGLDESRFAEDKARNAWERDQRGKEFDWSKENDLWNRDFSEDQFDWQKNNDMVNWLPKLMEQMFAGGGGAPPGAAGGPAGGGGYYGGGGTTYTEGPGVADIYRM